MRAGWKVSFCCILLAVPVLGQETEQALTQQELSVVEAIKAKNRLPEEMPTPQPPADPMQVPPQAVSPQAADNDIQLSEYAKQQAWQEHKQTATPQEVQDEPAVQESEEDAPAAETEEAAHPVNPKCLTVAFIDIDIAFNEHPRTQLVKKQIDLKIKSKQREVENAKEIIAALEAENELLSRQLSQLKPFYERIVTDQTFLPKVSEGTDTLLLNNTLNRLIFAECEVLSATPLNTPGRLDDITERIGVNKKIIHERSFFIDNYKYQTREEILKLEQEEVKNILQDIYEQIKSFAKKRNIGAIVRKDEILYGQQPVNVTKDFVSRLKKSKKYRKK